MVRISVRVNIHLGPGGPPRLSLGRHGPLESVGQPRVFSESRNSYKEA